MKVITVLLVVALVISGWLPFPESVQAQDPAANRLMLMPTADAFPRRTCFGLHVLPYPTTVVPQFNIPMGNRSTLLTYAGVGAEVYSSSAWGLVSVALRYTFLVPDSSHWGMAVQGQLVGGVFLFGGKSGEPLGGFGVLPLGQLVVSSPQHPRRVHVGIAVHPSLSDMPFTPFAGGELSISRRVKISSELIWVAPGADEGYDSFLLGLVGFRFKWEGTTLDLASGILIEHMGWGYPHKYPVPPIVAIVWQL
jgi:hypothetical protein